MSILGFLHKCGTYLRGGARVIGYFETHPKTSGCVTLLVLSPLVHYYLKSRSTARLDGPILARIERGTKPTPIPVPLMCVDRPVEEKKITALICGEQKEKVQEVGDQKGDASKRDGSVPYFSVILGPSGTGKTLLTRKVCMKYPVGVLYHEVYDPESFAKELGEAVGMATRPNSIIDLALSAISDTYHHYHTLPCKPDIAMAYVLDKIAAQARIFKKKHGYSPSLVIDGVDLVAKSAPDVFVDLIDRAKYLANERVLHIVLVCSEGNVVPLLDSTSSKTRITHVEEIVDISDNEAKAFLMTEMPEDVAQEVVSNTGGRIIHLIQALTIYSQEKDRINKRRPSDVIVGKLMSRVQSSITSIMEQPTCKLERKIMKHLANQGITTLKSDIDISSLVDVYGDHEKKNIAKAVEHLVAVNVLRYKEQGMIAFHSRLIEKYVKKDVLPRKW